MKQDKIEIIKTKKPFKIADIIILLILIIISVCLIVFLPKKQGTFVEVYVDDVLVLQQSLDIDYERKIYTNNGEHYNIIKIESGYVYVIDADCDDKTCINMGKTNTINKSIICLPHNFKIVIIGSADDGVDGII